MTTSLLRAFSLPAVAAVVAVTVGVPVAGQAPAQPPAATQEAPAPEAPPTPRASAPIDLTGTWMSVVTEDWRWRMVTPPKGDYASIPLTEDGLRMANSWDPAKDEADGQACKAYGAAGLMRIPTRLRISWEDESTLKVETDAGTQTRLLHFGDWDPAGRPASLQGDSKAEWETPRGGGRGQPTPPGGHLKVVTTNLAPGYLRKNGVAYGDETTLTEYWDLLPQPTGDQWIVITTIVEDAKYLSRPYITTPNFKKEPDSSKWDPSPCYAD